MRYYIQFRGILDRWLIDPLANESSNFKKYRLKLLIVHFGRHCPIVVALIANPACLPACQPVCLSTMVACLLAILQWWRSIVVVLLDGCIFVALFSKQKYEMNSYFVISRTFKEHSKTFCRRNYHSWWYVDNAAKHLLRVKCLRRSALMSEEFRVHGSRCY